MEKQTIYTSAYFNHGIDPSRVKPISVSRIMPRYSLRYKVEHRLVALAPEFSFMKKPEKEFRLYYLRQLHGIGIKRVEKMLESARKSADGRDLLLLCFEDIRVEGNWCHRSMFGEWYQRHTGIEVLELPWPAEQPPKKSRAVTGGLSQLSMFLFH